MSTQSLTFNFPLSPKPNAGNDSSVLHTANGWTLTVKKTGTDRQVSVPQKTVRISLTASRYSAFCGAFQVNSGSKSVSVTYTNSTVQVIRWDSTAITLPDVGALSPLAAMLDEVASDAADSSRVS